MVAHKKCPTIFSKNSNFYSFRLQSIEKSIPFLLIFRRTNYKRTIFQSSIFSTFTYILQHVYKLKHDNIRYHLISMRSHDIHLNWEKKRNATPSQRESSSSSSFSSVITNTIFKRKFPYIHTQFVCFTADNKFEILTYIFDIWKHLLLE